MKNDRSIEDADALERERADPLHHIKAEGMSEDMQRMMQKLHTPDAAKVSPPPLTASACGSYNHVHASSHKSIAGCCPLSATLHGGLE